MKRLYRPVVLVLSLMTWSSSHAVTSGQIDDFQSAAAGAQGWVGGKVGPPPTRFADGGPNGVGDGYLQIETAGFHLGAKNELQWTGDYLAAGIQAIEMDLNHITPGADPVEIRILIFGPGGAFASVNRTPVLAADTWDHYVFGLAASDLVYVPIAGACPNSGGAGTGVLADTLASVTKLLIRNDILVPTPICNHPPHITAKLGIDNIHAMPAVTLISAMSRKTHGAGGDWDIDVGVGDVECRSFQLGTANPNQLKIVATFDSGVAVVGGTAAVQADLGTVAAVTQTGVAEVTIDVTDLPLFGQLNLSFVDNPTTPTAGVVDANFPTDPAHASPSTRCIRMIVGDYDSLDGTNFLDFAQVKNAGHLNQLVDSAGKARADFDCGSRANFLDFAKVKNAGLVNQTAPACTPPIGP